MKLDKFKAIVANTPDDVKEDVKLSMDILERIHELLDEKFDGKQKLLADKLGKSEAEISKWLNGVHNFTTKTIAKLQAAFGEPIIAVCTSHDNATFTQVKMPFNRECTRMSVTGTGNLEENVTDYNTGKIVARTTEGPITNPTAA